MSHPPLPSVLIGEELPPTPHTFPADDPRPCPANLENLKHAWAIFGNGYFTWILAYALAVIAPNALITWLSTLTNQAMGYSLKPYRPLAPGSLAASYALVIVLYAFAGLLEAGYLRLILLRLRGYRAGIANIFQLNGQFAPLLAWGLIYGTASSAISLLVGSFGHNNYTTEKPDWLDFISRQGGATGLELLAFVLLCLVPMIIIDQRRGVRDAIQLSVKSMTPRFLQAMGLVVLACLFSMLGVLAFIIGIFFTLPFLTMLIASFYYDSFIAPSKQEAA